MKISKCLLIFLCSVVHVLNLTAQCENIGFEEGDFSSWDAYTGSCCGAPVNNLGVVSGRHTIISDFVPDPYTGNNLMTMPLDVPGAYVARLGNSNPGGDADRLSRTFTVDPLSQIFVFKYAIVLEDPSNHLPEEMPKFSAVFYDANGNVISPLECGFYEVTAGAETNDWAQNGTVRYKDWSTVAVDLSSHNGNEVTVEFTVQDCGLGGHFGYVYLDAYCEPLTINVNGFCPGNTEVQLTAPYGFSTYFWPQTNDTVSEISIPMPQVGDTVWVQLTNDNGCVNEIGHVFQVMDSTVASEDQEVYICAGSDVDLTVYGDYATDQFEWYQDSLFIANAQSINVSPDTTTVYNVVVSNQNGCTSDDSLVIITVYVNDSLVFNLAPYYNICLGDTVEIVAPENTGEESVWTNQFGQEISSNDTLIYAPTFTQTFTLSVSDSACSYSDDIRVNVFDPGNLVDTIIVNYCEGDSVTTIFAPQNFIQSTWSNGMVGNPVSIDPNDFDSIRVVLEHEAGCMDSILYILEELQILVPEIAPASDTICLGDSIHLDVSTGAVIANYFWNDTISGNIYSGSSLSLELLESTVFVVSAQSDDGCSNEISYDTVAVVVDTSAYFSLPDSLTFCSGYDTVIQVAGNFDSYEWFSQGSLISVDSFCELSSVQDSYSLTVNSGLCSHSDTGLVELLSVVSTQIDSSVCNSASQIVLSVPSGTAYQNFYWPQFANNSLENTVSPLVTDTIITIWAEQNSGCMDTIRYNLDVSTPASIVASNDTTLCYDDEITLFAQYNSSSDSIYWHSNEYGTFYSDTITVSISEGTMFYVFVENELNCIADSGGVDSVSVSVVDNYLLDSLMPQSVCPNQPVAFGVESSLANVTWLFDGVTYLGDSCFFVPEGTGVLEVQSSYESCFDEQEVFITVYDLQDFSINSNSSTHCLGDSIVLALSPEDAQNVEWYLNNNFLLANSSLPLELAENAQISVIVQDTSNCVDTVSYDLIVLEVPSLNLGDDIELCNQNEFEIFPIQVSEDVTYLWSDDSQGQSLVVSETGYYSLQITSQTGCSFSDSVFVNLDNFSLLKRIPNVFTPNGDNLHETFEIKSENLESYHLVILNRWGNVMFESYDPNIHWDGTANDLPASEGEYFYRLDYVNLCDGEKVSKVGFLMLRR